MNFQTLMVAGTVAGLAACGGSDGGGTGVGLGPGMLPPGTTLPVFPAAGSGPFTTGEITSYANFPTIDLNALPQALPGGSSATYDGIVELQRFAGSGTTNIVGRATMTADFTAATVSGSTDTFIEVTGALTSSPSITGTLGGSIPISSGGITSTGFFATYDGTLTSGSQNLNVNSSVLGIFGDLNGQDVAVGMINGTIGGTDTLAGILTGNKR